METLKKLSKETVLKLCRAYPTLPRQDVEDSVQSSFLKWLETHGNLDKLTPAWLYTAAKNKLIDIWRHNNRAVHNLPERLADDGFTTFINIAQDSQRKSVKQAAETLAYPEE